MHVAFIIIPRAIFLVEIMTETYENLEQYRAENQDKANSLGKVISEQLKGIAAFAALNIGVGLFKGVGASLGKGVLSGFRSSSIGRFKPIQKADQTITKAVSSAYTKVNDFLSGSGGLISKQRATYDSWHRKQEAIKARTFSDYKEKDFGMADISARLKAQREYYSQKWSSFFRNDGKFGSRVVGKLTKSAKPIASDLALFYTSELILDPSGSDKNPISSAIHNLPAAIGFRSLGSIGKGIANVSRNATYNILKDAHVDRFTDSIISGIQKVNKNGTAFYETLLQSAQRIKKTPVNLRHPVETLKDFSTTFIDNFKNFRNNYQNSSKAFALHQNIKIRDVEQMIVNAKKIQETTNKKELEKLLSQQYTEYNKKMDTGQVADAIGLNRRQTLNEAGSKQIDILRRRLQNRKDITFKKTKRYDELENIIQYTLAWERKNASKGVSLLDRGIYKSKSGKTVDTRGIRITLRDDATEGDLINRIYNTANNLINIGPIKPLEIFQIGNLPGVRVKQSLGFKKPYTANLPNSNLTEYGQDLFNQQKELGVKQLNRNIKPIINIDGHYYANKDSELVRITKERMPVVLMPHAASIMKATLNEMINDKTLYAKQVKQNIEMNNGTATDHFLNDTFDLRNPFKNPDGLLNRLIHPFRKFTSKRGPLQFQENYEKVANIIINNNAEKYTPDELNVISDRFLSSMLNITNYARKRTANLFTNNKYVENIFNIDVDIKTDKDLYRKIKELKSTVDTTNNKELKTLFKDLKVNNLIANLNESNYKLLFNQKAHALSFMESSTQRDNLKMVLGLSKMFQNQDIVIQTELADLIKSGKINTVDKNSIESYIQYIRGTAGFNDIGLKDNSFEIAKSIYKSLPKDTVSQFQSLSKQFEHNFGKIKEYYYFDDWKTFENRRNPTGFLDKIPDEDFYNAIPGYKAKWEVSGRNITGSSFFGKLETKRVNEVVNEYTGLGLTTGKYESWGEYVGALFTKRILPISGALYGLSFADNLIDTIPGIPKPSQVIQDTAVGARRIMAGIYDTIGLTSVAQYMEGLMPGSVDSPLGKMARTVGSIVGGNYLAKSFGFSNIASTAIGYGLSALQGFGFMDLSKSREDIEDIYSGRREVPIKAGRGWLFSFSNYEGDKIKYFSPSDYVINKSNARNDIYGGVLERTIFKPLPILNMNPIGDIIDSGHYAKKLQYSYPVPQSNSIGTDLPLIGPFVGYLTNKLPFIGASNIREHEWKNPNIQTGLDDYGNGFSQYDRDGRLKSGIYSRVASANSFGQSFDEMLYKSQEIIGLHGFAMNAALEKMYGRRPFENERLIENSSSITSSSRKFWETGGSDPFMLNEILRRLNPKPRNNRSVETYNPLFNTKGDWLPEELQIGNVLSKIERAEIRTPGRAYEALHTVNKSMPVTADYLGLTPDEAARQMLGLYKRDANRLRDRIAAKEDGLRASEGVLTYDPYLDIAGYYDKIVSVNSKRVLYKNINIDENYMGPSQQDLSQLNWLLGNTKSSYGVLTYSANGQVVRTENLQFNEELYNRDIARLSEARKIAQVGLDQGVGFGANTYSHIDRLRILGDVAPYSQEYKREKAIVSIQAKNDTRLQEQMEEIERKKKFASLPKELYPYRFKGRMFNPGDEQNEWNLNENIRPANSYSFGERLIGNIWERISHANTIINTKFLNYRTPLEEYQRSYLYGSNMKPWQTPVKSFVEPWLENLRSQESVTGGAITAFTGSYLLSGSRSGIATMGAILGGAYGGLNEIYRGLTDTAYIPERVQEEREVNRLFDRIKYERGNFLYNLTGDTMYKKEAKNTLTYLSQQGPRVFDGQIISATYKQEKPYMQYFLKETNSNNREDILRMVPEEIGDILTTQWEKNDNKQINDYLSKPKKNVFSKIDIPQTDWVGYDANVDLDDIKLAYINSKSMNNFNFGLGYLKQARKLERNPYINNIAAELNDRQNMQPSRLPQDTQSLKKSIDDLLNAYQIKGNVVVTNSNIDVLTIVNG